MFSCFYRFYTVAKNALDKNKFPFIKSIQEMGVKHKLCYNDSKLKYSKMFSGISLSILYWKEKEAIVVNKIEFLLCERLSYIKFLVFKIIEIVYTWSIHRNS